MDELEAIGQITLVANEQQPALLLRIRRAFISSLLGGRDFGPKLDAPTYDAFGLRSAEKGEVVAWVGLASMCCEGAASLREGVVAEVVILGGVSADRCVVEVGGEVDWAS